MRPFSLLLGLGLAGTAALVGQTASPVSFTLDQVKSYPFPNELTASATGARIAWAFNEQGRRNIWVADGPAYTPRKLTEYPLDDGQALSAVSLSPDGQWVVYIRGGDFGSNWDDALPVNPTFAPTPPKVQIWAAPFLGGQPHVVGEGENPVVSPGSDRVAFERGGQIWLASIDGTEPARALFIARGRNGSAQWSPDGSQLAFVSVRGDHSFIGIYTDSLTPIQWISPSYTRDGSPRWSPDGRHVAFVRAPGAGGPPDSLLARRSRPWSIWTAEVATGVAHRVWQSDATLRGTVPSTHGGTNLHWAAGRIVFLSYLDGWPHLYSIPESGGGALLLTPGRFMAEHIRMTPDRRWMVFAGNAGDDRLDIDRRHVVRVPVDRAAMEVMTPGTGNEWTPVVTGDGNSLVFLGATAQRPPLPTVMPFHGGAARVLAEHRIPQDYPTTQLVTPTQVVFQAPDGTPVHGQLFERPGGASRKAAIIYVHGGPPRQMLLGWHYSDYYANAYAMNQYLASLGFAVLSVNYRLGIGYGFDFHVADRGGTRGASEYQDVKAAAEWLAKQPQVDPARIGIYGGSYGGYLTALALGKNSDLFAAGVDIHGVHDRSSRAMLLPGGYEIAPDAQAAFETAWESSPVAWVDGWRSPVLIIHGDDDRNVRFSESTDLVQRLEAKGVDVELLVIVDDTHHFLRHANQVRVNKAAAEYLGRKLGTGPLP